MLKFWCIKSSDPEELEENCNDGETLQAAGGRRLGPVGGTSGSEFWWGFFHGGNL